MKEEIMDELLKLENQLCFPLYAAARKVTNLYTPFFKPLGITYTQYIVFLVLWEKKEVTVGDLGRRLYLDNGTLTPLLKKLEENGYIARTRSKKDERVVTVSITQKGMDLKEKAADIPIKAGSCISLSPEEAAGLYTLLYKILDSTESQNIDEQRISG